MLLPGSRSDGKTMLVGQEIATELEDGSVVWGEIDQVAFDHDGVAGPSGVCYFTIYVPDEGARLIAPARRDTPRPPGEPPVEVDMVPAKKGAYAGVAWRRVYDDDGATLRTVDLLACGCRLELMSTDDEGEPVEGDNHYCDTHRPTDGTAPHPTDGMEP